MKPQKLTEPEIVDAMIKKADPELEKRLDDALRKDLKTGALYAKWGDFIPQIQKELPPLQKISANVAKGVMEQIKAQKINESIPREETDRPWWQIGGYVNLPLAKVLVPACAAMLLACLLLFGKMYRDSHSLCVGKITGNVLNLENLDAPTGTPLKPSTRLFFPVCVKTLEEGSIELILPKGNTVIVRENTLIRIQSGRSVWQKRGLGHYNITKWEEKKPFTVQIPQGSIIDLGTRFDVEVKELGGSILTVREGKVRVIPASGAEIIQAVEDDCVLVSANRALKIQSPSTKSLLPRSSATVKPSAKKPSVPIRLSLNPVSGILHPENNLRGFISPSRIPLSPVEDRGQLLAPTKYASGLYSGVLQISHNRELREYAVGMGKDTNSGRLIFFDLNQNGDPFDDPPFREGRDYDLGEPFLAWNPDKGPAIYLKHPIRIIRSEEKTILETDPDHLEVLNFNCYRDIISFKPDPDQTESYIRDVIILDSDSDGDFQDEDGALVIWGREEKPETLYNVIALAPWGKPIFNMGYIWNLSLDNNGDYRIEGTPLEKKGKSHKPEMGDPFPVMHVQTLKGDNISFDAPKGGFFLLYIWSTWYSACQKNVPFEFHDMATRFKDRGLKMVGVSTDYRKEDLSRYLKTRGIDYPQVYNGPQLWEGITAKLGIDHVPASILVDDTGTVVLIDREAEVIWSFLDRNLPGVPVNQDIE